MPMHHMDVIAKRKAGDIEGWEPFEYERVTGGLIIKGCIPEIISRGPRKGQKRASKDVQTVLVTCEEMEAEMADYEAKTGKCGECYGEGARPGSRTAGDCPRCHGTGAAPEPQKH